MEYGSVLYVPESMKSVYEGTSYVGVFSQIVGMDAETVGLSNIVMHSLWTIMIWMDASMTFRSGESMWFAILTAQCAR